MTHPTPLTAAQWTLLRGINLSCPVSVDAIGHFGDIRSLLEQKLVMLRRAKVWVTLPGIEALWYHQMH
ncbi:hypothetical protein [Dyella sp. 20L07]|uniref:hypothetical protein n=1 Tax=Dyella sp. 20L07 TaxID=3384240 RepID=UPI003D2AC3B3